MKRKNVIISALVLAIALTGCSGKKVDYNMETENINTKAGSDISAFDDSTKWNDSFSVEISDKSVDVDISADITLPDCKSMSVVEVKNKKVGTIVVGGSPVDSIQYELIDKQFDCMAKYLSWNLLFQKSYYATAKDELSKNQDAMKELEDIGKEL